MSALLDVTEALPRTARSGAAASARSRRSIPTIPWILLFFFAAVLDAPRAARGIERASARRRALRTFVPTGLSRASTSVACARSAAGSPGCSLVSPLRRLERLELGSQVGDFPAQLRDLPALLDEFGGEAAQREAESSSAKLGADSRQVRLVVRGRVTLFPSRGLGFSRPCTSGTGNASAGSRLSSTSSSRCSTSSTVVNRADASTAQVGMNQAA
jgi:hypothetical protein